ncbi:MAG: MFS transporter [Pseudomonadota bacterium]
MRGPVFLRQHPTLALAGAGAFSMSTLFSAMKPILLTRYVEQLGLSEGLAGLIVALPFTGIALSAALMRGFMLRGRYTTIAAGLGVVLVAAELLSASRYASLRLLLPAQLVSGICVGLLMGLTSRYIARTASPDQLFGFVDMTAVLLMSFMVYGVGLSVAGWGVEGGYLAAVAICGLFALLVLCFRPPHRDSIGSGLDPTHPAGAPQTALRVGVRELAVVAMGVLFVTCSGIGFAFMFTLATNLGMGMEAASGRIGVLLFVSALACQVGGWASARFGPERPLAGAFVVCAFGWALAVGADSTWIYMASLVPAIFSLQFCFPILLSFSASLDGAGRWAAIATPLITSGFAWASIVAGQVVGRWGLDAIAWTTGAGLAVCLLLLCVAVRAGERGMPGDELLESAR